MPPPSTPGLPGPSYLPTCWITGTIQFACRIVVRVPGELESPLAMDDQRPVLGHCAYWLSLRGLPPTANKKSKSVRIRTGRTRRRVLARAR